MKRLNPFYLLALFSVLFLLSLWTLFHAKKEQETLRASLESVQKLAYELHALQNIYANKQEQQKRVDILLKSPQLKDSGVVKEQKKSSWHLSSASMTQKELEFLLGKVFNANFTIKSLQIKRIESQKARLDLELQW